VGIQCVPIGGRGHDLDMVGNCIGGSLISEVVGQSLLSHRVGGYSCCGYQVEVPSVAWLVVSVVMLVVWCGGGCDNCRVLFSGVFACISVIVCIHVVGYVGVVRCGGLRVCNDFPHSI